MGGKRHSELWAPIRLVFALGMLVPVSNGFNTIQLVTIALAHAGSGLGTTVWNSFQNTLTNPGNNTPTQTVDDLDEFVSKVFLIATCEEAANAFGGANTATSSGPVSQTVSGTAINYTMNYNLAPYQTGGCGTITVSASSASAGNSWMSVATGVYTTADTYAQKVVGMANSGGGAGYDSHADPGINWSTIISNLQTQITSTAQGLNANNASATTTTDSNGWANAGAVFIKMAQQASASAAAQARTFSATLPDPGLLPVSLGGSAGSIGSNAGCLAQGATTLMGGSQTFACSGTAAKETTAVLDSMSGYLVAAQNTAGVDAPLGGTSGSAGHDGVKWLLSKLAPQLQGVTSYLSGTTSTASTSSNGGSQAQTFGTAIFQIINFGNILFGLDGILWTLAIVAGAQGLGFSFGFGAVMILSILGSLVFSLALIFAIYIPLMPAIRFLFGIITWLVTIFEALVAMPIVMLVHLKSDGEGLWAHGQQGYLLLLQMLLRPVLMVFGLLGAVLVFTTLIEFIATSIIGTWFTVSGGNTMFLIGSLVSIFELFAFLVVYGFTVYSVANVSFNLINVIPDRILAWIGSSSPMHTADGMQDVMQSQSQLAGAHGNATGFLSQRQAVKSAIEPPARAPGDGGGDEKTPGALPKPGGGGGGGGGVKPANDSGNQQNLPGGPANDE
jgi:conjugal transfer/type IV secretion protein DotA/TraY